MTAALLICALLLDAALGEPDWLWTRFPHPAVLMGRVVGWMDRHWNRGPDRKARGIAVAGLLTLGGLGLGWLVSALPFGPVWEVLVAAILLAQRSLADHVRDVGLALGQGIGTGRAAVARIVGRDTAAMDESAIARAAIESAAENFSDAVVAPAFWFLLLGLPGLIACKAINTADSMIGYRTEKYADFGWASARLDDAVNWFPARLSALLIALPHGVRDAAGIRADAALHRSPNAGWPEAAMARALNVALSGPRSYGGRMRDFPFVNRGGRHEIGREQILAATRALWKSWTVLVVFLAVFILV